MGCELVVFPELALTTFFPRWWMTDQAEIDAFFEREMPSHETAPLFDEAQAARHRLLPGLRRARATRTAASRHFNTSILVERDGTIVGKYRKVHLPGHEEHEPWRPFQHLEKRYFELGNLGFPVYRRLRRHHRHVHLQRPALARDLPRDGPAGRRAGAARLQHADPLRARPTTTSSARLPQPARRCRPAPTRTAPGWSAWPRAASRRAWPRWPTARSSRRRARWWRGPEAHGDELVVPSLRPRRGQSYKRTTFNFAIHRQPDQYRMIVERKGALDPS